MATISDTTERNKQFVREEFAAAWNEGRFDPAWYTSGFTYHGLPTGTADYEGYTEAVGAFRDAFPDMDKQVETCICEGEEVLVRYTVEMTHDGDLMGIEATGEPVSAHGMVLYRLEDGRIAEGWIEFDQLGIMQQIGAVPEP
jgi:predicted ester cyclase